MEATKQKHLCPISGKLMRPWILMPVDFITGKTHPYGQIYWCDDSQYGAIIPPPDKENLGKFYDLDQYYTHGTSHIEKVEDRSFLDKLRVSIAWRFEGGVAIEADYINNVICQQTSCDILEIGSGSGSLLKKLADLGHRVCGIEPDHNAGAFKKNLEVYQGTGEEIPEAVMTKTFDLVLMNQVLEHCIDPVKTLTNINSLLRSGGKFMCTVPNNEAYCLADAGVTWQFLDVPRHLNFFTGKSLRGICEKTGFEVESVFYNAFGRQFTNTWINTEMKTWDKIKASQVEAYPMPKARMSKTRAWQRMFMTLLASDEKKYECVGVIAVKPN